MTPEQQTAMRQALEALETPVSEETPLYVRVCDYERNINKAITALRQALEQQPAGEPFMWVCNSFGDDEWETTKHKECEHCIPLYTRPQPAAQCEYIRHGRDGTHWCALAEKTAAQWVGLDGFEIERILTAQPNGDHMNLHWFCNAAKAIEAKLREKNTGEMK